MKSRKLLPAVPLAYIHRNVVDVGRYTACIIGRRKLGVGRSRFLSRGLRFPVNNSLNINQQFVEQEKAHNDELFDHFMNKRISEYWKS